MRPFASYEITLVGSFFELKEAIDCIADAIEDQPDVLPNLLDKYYSYEDEDDIILFLTQLEADEWSDIERW